MLFGHQNDDTNQPVPDISAPQDTPLAPPPPAPTSAPSVNPLAADHDTGASLPVAPSQAPDQPDEPQHSVLDQPSPSASGKHAVIEPVTPFSSSPEPSHVSDTPAHEPASLDAPESNDTPSSPISDDLLHLKQQALSQLSPLVGKLDQTPEEKFRTTMMLIQSTDNQALLQDAYTAAQAITDEKARAQALLDVVNEINYFSQAKPAA